MKKLLLLFIALSVAEALQSEQLRVTIENGNSWCRIDVTVCYRNICEITKILPGKSADFTAEKNSHFTIDVYNGFHDINCGPLNQGFLLNKDTPKVIQLSGMMCGPTLINQSGCSGNLSVTS